MLVLAAIALLFTPLTSAAFEKRDIGVFGGLRISLPSFGGAWPRMGLTIRTRPRILRVRVWLSLPVAEARRQEE
jgi:hypothetical protein